MAHIEGACALRFMKVFRGRRGLLAALAGTSVTALANAGVAPCVEDFPSIDSLPFQGWSILNASNPLGPTSWHQGDPSEFPAAGGAPDSYAAADSTSTIGAPSLISVWLVTPDIDFGPNEFNAKSLAFATRALPGEANRLVVRQCAVSATETCEPPAAGVGGFDRMLIDINPDLLAGGYPSTWTTYTATPADGLLTYGLGRIAFHYTLMSEPDGSHGSTIGIDTVTIAGATTCPFGDAVFVSSFE
jgi:hypothetical protein